MYYAKDINKKKLYDFFARFFVCSFLDRENWMEGWKDGEKDTKQKGVIRFHSFEMS